MATLHEKKKQKWTIKNVFLKNPPGFSAFETSSCILTSNRSFWSAPIYRDINFVPKCLPEQCDLPIESHKSFSSTPLFGIWYSFPPSPLLQAWLHLQRTKIWAEWLWPANTKRPSARFSTDFDLARKEEWTRGFGHLIFQVSTLETESVMASFVQMILMNSFFLERYKDKEMF